jgi:hypothetical protein
MGRYVESIPAVLVETCDETIGECEQATPLDKARPHEDDLPLIYDHVKEDEKLRRRLLACTGARLFRILMNITKMCFIGAMNNCPVHNTQLRRTALENADFAMLKNDEEISSLIACLNARGFRESELIDNITFLRSRIVKQLVVRTFSEHVINNSMRSFSDIRYELVGTHQWLRN